MAIKPIAASAVLALLAGCGGISPEEEASFNNQVIAQLNHARVVCAKHEKIPMMQSECERDLVMQKAIEINHPDKDLIEAYMTVMIDALQMIESGAADQDTAFEYLKSENARILNQIDNRALQRQQDRADSKRMAAALFLGMQHYGQSQALQNQSLQTNCTSSLTGRFMNTITN